MALPTTRRPATTLERKPTMTSIPTSPEVRSTLAAQHRRTRRRAAFTFTAALLTIGALAGWLLAVAIRVVGQ